MENQNTINQSPVQTPNPVPSPAQKQGMSSTTKIILGVVGGILLLILCCCVTYIGFFGLAGFTVVQEVQKQLEEQNKAFDNPSKINEIVKTGEVEWKVTSAKYIGSTLKANSQYLDDCKSSAHSTFIKVTLTVENKDYKEVNLKAPIIVDSERKEYSRADSIYRCASSDTMSYESLNPNVNRSYTVYYEIPVSAKNLKLKVDDGEYDSYNVKYIDLDLD